LSRAPRADPLDERGRVGAEAGRLVPIVGIHDVDQVVDDGRAFRGSRFPGRRVHAAVDLPGVGADHLDRDKAGERHRDRRLPDTGGARDHDHAWLCVSTHRSQCTRPVHSAFE